MSLSKSGKKEDEKPVSQQQQGQEPEPGKVDIEALKKELTEKGVSFQQFAGAEETWRKRALKFGTPESKYEEMKLKHKWLYDQPIN